jgi:hypothetical protein
MMDLRCRQVNAGKLLQRPNADPPLASRTKQARARIAGARLSQSSSRARRFSCSDAGDAGSGLGDTDRRGFASLVLAFARDGESRGVG